MVTKTTEWIQYIYIYKKPETVTERFFFKIAQLVYKT